MKFLDECNDFAEQRISAAEDPNSM